MENLSRTVLAAIRDSNAGISTLDVLESLRLCDTFTLKTTLSRLGKAGKILRLKRGVYATNPLKDAISAAQATFSGYIGFSSALYIHKLIAESPFSITVVTTDKSASKAFGAYEFRAVALKERAVGFESIGDLVVSTKAKTLFDCTYLERYSIEKEKIIEAYNANPMSTKEWKEFDSYVTRFINTGMRYKFDEIKKRITKS